MSQVSKQILIKGVVQGVGFRPFVYRTALAHHISGHVINLGNMVRVIACGTAEDVDSFLSDLTTKNPPLSRIDETDVTDITGAAVTDSSITDSSITDAADANVFVQQKFLILESAEGESGNSIIPPDTAICADCLFEIKEKGNRRFMYPFTVCTNCGPRYTTLKKLPYDRKNTTMDVFSLCEDCLLEYANVGDRRYHAQPTCCPKCGPTHSFETADKSDMSRTAQDRIVLSVGNDALKEAAKAIDDGFIVAVKGDGGFHLVCDAFLESAVSTLRKRLNRMSQPFAVMVRDEAAAFKEAVIRSDKELPLLQNIRRPIVVCNKSPSFGLAPSVVPHLHNIGMMLPYSGTHHVLFEYLKTDVVVMTSANLPGLPMVIDNDDAFEKLSHVADYFLFHNRLIQNRTDDTVIRFVHDEPIFLRRSRGFVPERIILPFSHSASVAGVGAEMNNTVSFSKDGRIYLSQYIGNTKHLQTAQYHSEAFMTLQKLTGIHPTVLGCDLHPNFNTTKFAEEYAEKSQSKPQSESQSEFKNELYELHRIQHHHAHICSVMADNQLPLHSAVIGVAIDGVGYGSDGTVWGGEILKCTYTSFERLSSLMPQPLVGGDLATKYPSRLVYAMLYPYVVEGKISEDELLSLNLYFKHGETEKRIVLSQLQNQFNISLSTGMGRVLDAASSLLSLCSERTYDGEPSMILESAAYRGLFEKPNLSRFKPTFKSNGTLDTSHLLYQLYLEMTKEFFSKNELAVMFVHALSLGIGQMILEAVLKTGISTVCLSGGVANNDYIVSVLYDILKEKDIRLLTHKNLPPGDGCISHGQAAFMTAYLKEMEK
ncbi:MAG: carbamoyltransferase HypF [Methanimicrococcus sp.]|nr:carbamoyltransferase HypF [Methanimicrococcus sp.]MCL2141452.1 carbamoyltransferase HypF [Methanimicrococcus sp.]